MVALKETGASWLRIQGDTGIPRRSARRAFEEWERSKSTEELRIARTNVAAEEFRKHLDMLSSLAESLVVSLHLPQTMEGLQDADGVLGVVWRKEFDQVTSSTIPQSASYDEDRTIRRNDRLFRALQDHTREKVRWQTLIEWKQARNDYCAHLKSLHSEAGKILSNIHKNELYLKSSIKKLEVRGNAIDAIATGVVEAVIWGFLTSKPEEVHAWEGTSLTSKGTFGVIFGDATRPPSLLCLDMDPAKGIVKACKWAIDNLRKGEKSDLLQAVAHDIQEMHGKAKELEDMLDVLALRPLILRTRCDLCPA